MARVPNRCWAFALVLCLLNGAVCAIAQEKSIPFRITDDLVYGHKDGLALTLDVLEPERNRKGIGLILVSSGGWNSRKSDIPGESLERLQKDHWAQGLVNGGYTVFVVRHGSSPRYSVPEMVPGMNRAVRYVRSISRKYGVDPDHLGITSGSSGGHLSLMAAVTGDNGNPDSKDPIERISSKVQCVVAWFPPTDLVNWGATGGYSMIELARPGFFKRVLGEVKELEPQLKAISPIYFVNAESPPLLLIHGDADKTVPLQQSEIMKTKYEEVGRPVKLIVQPGGGHSGWSGVMDQYPAVWEWFDQYLATKPDPSIISQFDWETLSKAPAVFSADEAKAEGVKSFFYQGVNYHGKPTRVFAYYGVPENQADSAGKKFPAMVLVHGGGGSAFDRWVKLWNKRGYAAIAMDLCGCVPVGTYGNWQRHEQGGPPGWDASFQQVNEPIQDQWTYHAASAVALAHSLIRSYPEVDTDRIGVTGISWGGYMTCVVAGLDSRFQFAAPVYGCGFLGSNSAWLPAFDRIGPTQSSIWLKNWDPSNFLVSAKMPMLWVNGTNDFAYPMDSWQKSYRLPAVARELCLRVRMPHNHTPDGENPEEIRVFADAQFGRGKPLAKILEQGQTDGKAWAKYQGEVPIVKAELNFTTNTGRWQERKWQSISATIDANTKQVEASIPAEAKAFYLNLFDERNCVVSTEHVEQ